VTSEIHTEVIAAAQRSRQAAAILRTLPRAAKDVALKAIAQALRDETAVIVAANVRDVEAARLAGTDEAIVDRLTLTPERLDAIAQSVDDIVNLADPVGEVVRGYTLPNGLEVRQVRVPLGVVAMVYEARPNVTVDAATLCLKSGNAAFLRGSTSAKHSNSALVAVMQSALEASGVLADAIMMVPGDTHEAVNAVMTARGLVDVIIPRGGAGLIKSVVSGSTVPVIETGVGNCHVYVDRDADLEKALAIVLNSKTQRVSVCNAAESLLVHADVAEDFIPRLMSAFKVAQVRVHGDTVMNKYAQIAGVQCEVATDEDWEAEYYSLDIAARTVESFEEAVAHIHRWSTGHTEAIVTESTTTARNFVAAIDSAAVMVNASTRFTDGGEFGFGAEIGISTQKLHARGPMGLVELTSTKYVVSGDGHIRS